MIISIPIQLPNEKYKNCAFLEKMGIPSEFTIEDLLKLMKEGNPLSENERIIRIDINCLKTPL